MSKQNYQDRNRVLREIGYPSYTDYLASALWESIKQRVYAMKGANCFLCEKKATVVHHRGYGREVLVGTNLSPLVPLCFLCHEKVELKSFSKEKRTLAESQGRFNALLKRRKFGTKKLPPEERKELPGYCSVCGFKARKGARFCKQHQR